MVCNRRYTVTRLENGFTGGGGAGDEAGWGTNFKRGGGDVTTNFKHYVA